MNGKTQWLYNDKYNDMVRKFDLKCFKNSTVVSKKGLNQTHLNNGGLSFKNLFIYI